MKRIKAFAVIFALCLLITGCSNGRSLSDLTIVQAVGIDRVNGKTSVSIQYLNLDKSGSTTDSLSSGITSVVVGSANSISNAISLTSAKLSKELFFGQNKIIVFGKDYIANGIDKDFDYLLRSVDSRPDVLVAVSNNTAENVLNSKERDARVPAESLYNLIKTGQDNGVSVFVSVNDVLNAFADKTSDIYLPVLTAGKNAYYCDGIAIFSNEKLATVLDKNDSLGLLFLQNKVNGGFLEIMDNELGKIDLEISRSKTKLKINKAEDSLALECEISASLMLDEVEFGLTSAIDDDKMKLIESLTNNRIEAICEDAFYACINHKSDPIMLGRILAKDCPKEYDSLKDDWLNNLSKFRVKISVKSNLEKVNDTALRD